VVWLFSVLPMFVTLGMLTISPISIWYYSAHKDGCIALQIVHLVYPIRAKKYGPMVWLGRTGGEAIVRSQVVRPRSTSRNRRSPASGLTGCAGLGRAGRGT
jgi:hypothetical protein